MKILLLNQSFVSPDEPGHTRHFEMAKYLQGCGHELVIVGSDSNYQTGLRTVDRKGLYVEQVIEGVRVLRAYSAQTLHRSYFWRAVSFLSFMFSSVWAALQVEKPDLIMGTTPPIFQAVSAWLVALVRQKPFLLEVRDLWPEFAISMGVIRNPLVIALAHWLERFLYARATHVLVNSPAYKEYLLEKGIPQGKVTFIPYGTDTGMFSPQVDGSGLRRELGLQDKFTVVYAGAMGQAHDLYTVLRAAARLTSEPRIRFVFFGDGKERLRLEAEARRLGLTNVLFAGVYPKREMPVVLACADVCLAILQDIEMFRTTYPNKVFDYMAAGRATVLVIDGVIREVIEASGGGVFVQPGDDERLAQTILELSKDPPRVRQMGENARAYLVRHLDRRDKMRETLQLLENLAGK
ncbi:MAG TPA: glycosyltransferase family 4 protein [Chthonomonadales bacterium]|nr:glycosyltransferase family 4 protein [Chthonomonadales bacterium]